MKILIALFAMALAYLPTTSVGADSAAPVKPTLLLKYCDGKADGKKSIAGTGEMIRLLKCGPCIRTDTNGV